MTARHVLGEIVFNLNRIINHPQFHQTDSLFWSSQCTVYALTDKRNIPSSVQKYSASYHSFSTYLCYAAYLHAVRTLSSTQNTILSPNAITEKAVLLVAQAKPKRRHHLIIYLNFCSVVLTSQSTLLTIVKLIITKRIKITCRSNHATRQNRRQSVIKLLRRWPRRKLQK